MIRGPIFCRRQIIEFSPRHTVYLPSNSSSDPAGQLHMLEGDLATSIASHARPLIFGHIPPMTATYDQKPNWFRNITDQFSQLLSDYSSKSSLNPLFIFSHQHESNFRFYPFVNSDSTAPKRDINNKNSIFSMLVAAIAPVYLNNPAYRVLKYDRSTLIDFDEYFMDMSKVEGTWAKLYSASSVYGIDVFDANNVAPILADAFEKRSTIFSNFCNYVMISSSSDLYANGNPGCLYNSTRDWCTMISMEPEDWYSCVKGKF